MKRFSALILTVLTVLTAMGQNPADSTKVLFQTGRSQFSPMLGDNRVSMSDFVNKVRKAAASDGIDSLVVDGYASPDGDGSANLRLAKNRRKTIADYIAREAGIGTHLIHSGQGDVAWDELRLMVVANPHVPSREKVLAILDSTPVVTFDAHGRPTDSRKRRLMELDGGKPYRWLLRHVFPQLRSVVASLFYTMPSPDTLVSVAPSVAPEVEETGSVLVKGADTIQVKDTVLVGDTVAVALPEADPLHRFALKTNLLYDAALMPNLELEWRIDDQWSLAVEGDIAWWKKASAHKYYQIAMVSPELRRWFRTRGPWHGMYAGLFMGVGKYDLENGGTGYRGEGGMLGISYGYMWPIGRSLSLEAGIGAGYMYTRYKEYVPADGHYLYQRTKTLNYFGPLKLKFSLAWRFDDINKPHKNRLAP